MDAPIISAVILDSRDISFSDAMIVVKQFLPINASDTIFQSSLCISLDLVFIVTIKGGNLFTSLSHVKSSDVQAIWNTVGAERE